MGLLDTTNRGTAESAATKGKDAMHQVAHNDALQTNPWKRLADEKTQRHLRWLALQCESQRVYPEE
jgi:hypothetical protein